MLCPTNSSQLATQEHRSFLGLLAQDDSFRAELIANPLAVLAEHGIQLDPKDLPAAIQLPTKEAVRALFEGDDESAAQEIKPWLGLLG